MPQPFDARTYMTAMAALLRVDIDPAYEAGVVENLERMEGLAGLVMSFPLPDEVEPAPTFEA